MRKSIRTILLTFGFMAVVAAPSFGQEPDPGTAQRPKHVLWLIPNYRTTALPTDYEPLSLREKMKIAAQDSFDRGTFALAGIFAGIGQLSDSESSFGQGARGYGHRLATSYADLVIANYLTEAAFPTIFRQDPRYFRRGTGSTRSRFGYALRQVVWTRGDSGASQFNYSELLGNSAAVAISRAYYPDDRTASSAASSLAVQIAVDAAGNLVKEFWPISIHRMRSKSGKD